uniref:Ig-like domain-containing protein n=1 Tax=Xenopus tropicalis TaxID=8364 RepID=A0A803K633_XENTR
MKPLSVLSLFRCYLYGDHRLLNTITAISCPTTHPPCLVSPLTLPAWSQHSHKASGSTAEKMLRNGSKKLPVFLLPLLLLIGHAIQDNSLQVRGILNQSVYLSNPKTLDLPVEKVMWEVEINGEMFPLADYRDRHLEMYNNQFTNRLDVSNNGTALRIRELRKEDGTTFTAYITLINKVIKILVFHLRVYEPVPEPNLHTEVEKVKTTWCNITLHCSVPTNVSLGFFSWMYRNGSSGYQQYANGTTIHLSLMDIPQNMEFLCLVQNPAEQKNVSARVQEMCKYEQNSGKHC